MSRWLVSVNHLLESLDGQAGQIAEEHTLRQQEQKDDDDDDEGGGDTIGGGKNTNNGGNGLEDILAKRGLSLTESVEDDDENEVEEEEEDHNDGEDVVADGWDDDGMDGVDVSERPEEEVVSTEVDNDNAPAIETSSSAVPIVTAVSGTTMENDSNQDVTSRSNDEGTAVKDDDDEEEDVVAMRKEDSDGIVRPTKENEDFETNTTRPPSSAPAPTSSSISSSNNDASKEGTTTTPSKNPLPPQPKSSSIDGSDITTKKNSPPPPLQASGSPSKSNKPITPTSSAASSSSAAAAAALTTKKQKKELLEAQKEARTLRRHVVSLNNQLEAAEAEMKAQRIELEHVAIRIEKDTLSQKQKVEQLKTKHTQQIQTIQQEHSKLIQDMELKFQQQYQTQQLQLQSMETQLHQQGGDLNNELTNAIDREQGLLHTLELIKDEKSILEAQINTLQSQQEALGSRLESLTQTADNAMEREREAQDRLDSTLTQHAKQISQRQGREAELERQIQDLGAALVVARNRATAKSSSGSASFSEDGVGGGSNIGGENSNDVSALRARIDALECDLETANAHLQLERERSTTMHQELREMSKETTQEASAVHAKQVHYERQIADLSLTISKLQASLREANRDHSGEDASGEAMMSGKGNTDDDSANQVKMLSEEVLRLRDRMANQNSESLAMRNRLKEAADRASRAEEKLAMAMANGMESGGGGGGSDSRSHHSGNGPNRRRRGAGSSPSASLRSVMKLNPGQGERREQIGKAVDAVDGFAKTTAKYIRQNPLARAGFLAYFLLIHFWTFVVLFLHAHSFDPGHASDLGTMPHGPHAMIQQHQEQMQALDPVVVDPVVEAKQP